MGGERGRDEKGKGEGEGVKKYVIEICNGKLSSC